MKRLRDFRMRLADAVAVAALALLALKVVGWLATPAPTSVAADGLPNYGRVLAHARTNYVPLDVTMTGAVPAKEAEAAKEAAAAKGDDKVLPTAPKSPEPPAAAKPNPFESAVPSVSAAEKALLERLGARREELGQRGRDLEMRERLIEDAEKKLESRIHELKTVEEKAEASKAQATDDNAGLRNLVTMYETMKPKEAARVFDRLGHDVLVPVVLKMNPRKMAEVLAVMSPEAAEKLTVALAMRSRVAPADQRPAAASLPATELPAIETPAAPRR